MAEQTRDLAFRMPDVATTSAKHFPDMSHENKPIVSEEAPRSTPSTSPRPLSRPSIPTQGTAKTNTNTSRAAANQPPTTAQLTSHSTNPSIPPRSLIRPPSSSTRPRTMLAPRKTPIAINMPARRSAPSKTPAYSTFSERDALQARDPERRWLVRRLAEHPPLCFGSINMTTRAARIAAQALFDYDERYWPDGHLSVEKEREQEGKNGEGAGTNGGGGGVVKAETETETEQGPGAANVNAHEVYEVPETECLLDPDCTWYWWQGGNRAMAQLRRWEGDEEPVSPRTRVEEPPGRVSFRGLEHWWGEVDVEV